MKLIVGLGNPGRRYAMTKHNVGAMAVDHYAKAVDAGPFVEKFEGLFWKGRISWDTGDDEICILKPLTFMNLSGVSVSKAIKKFNLDPFDTIVAHDDMDIELGQIKVKHGGGTAGHNGLNSIVEHLGGERGFVRVRIGVGRPIPGF